ncbi:hypothetical protein ACPV3S_04355 [Photobacterium damselae]|uniref:hypothetical protein n=1 Tax=Photobacterium damselae TaxID=38293 RepID=UPI00406860EE
MKCLSHQSLILFSVGLFITTQIKAASSLEQDPNLYRHYYAAHEVQTYQSDTKKWSTEQVSDCLSLTQGPNHTVQFSLVLFATNSHVCAMEGSGIWVGDTIRYLPTPEVREEAPNCELEINVTQDAISLSDIGGACREFYCGIKANIDQARFIRTHTTEQECRLVSD